MSLAAAIDIAGVEVFEQVDLAKYTTIKLSIIGDIALVSTLDGLRALVKYARSKNFKYHLIGWGANQVIANSEGTLFIKLNLKFDRTQLASPKPRYRLPASAPLNVLQSHAQKFGIVGWEVITGIPASLGGAIYMNAGTALGEIGEIVESVEIMTPEGDIRTENITPESFSYRSNNFVKEGEVIIEAVLVSKGQDPKVSEKIKEYMEYRKTTQPLKSKNCGCVWKNSGSEYKAGLFVDKTGLHNLSFGDLEVSDLHSNFYENKGSATFQDFRALTGLLQDQLLLHTGIRFELEAKIY